MNGLVSEPRAVRVLRSLQHKVASPAEEASVLPREPRGERTRDVLSGCMARLAARPDDSFEPSRSPPTRSPH